MTLKQGTGCFSYEKGLVFKPLKLWLDSKGSKGLSFVSHVHTDHLGRHKKVILSKKTEPFYVFRLKRRNTLPKPFRETFYLNDYKVELFPSGHVLGSSQIMIQGEQKFVYTGDFKLSKGLTSEKAEVKRCDVLAMEATYGDPNYVFPPRKEVIGEIIDYVDDCLKKNETPVIFAYSLGKGQEIMKILSSHGFDVCVHRKIYQFAKIYERIGVNLGSYSVYIGEETSGKVLVFPSPFMGERKIRGLRNYKGIVVTGWAAAPWKKGVFSGNKGFPLSDHADFYQLIRYVEEANPEKVYIVYGFKSFTNYLAELGFEAKAF